ncbi:MAG: hypothetical protein EBU53_02170 [Proteobacteria bacterium]|nr:hypothetical protein [Pseudomonadota bacterium]
MKTVSTRSLYKYADRESFGEVGGELVRVGYSARFTPDDPDDDSDLFGSSGDIEQYTGKSALSGIELAAIILLRERASL